MEKLDKKIDKFEKFPLGVKKLDKTLKTVYWTIASASVGLSIYSAFYPEQIEAMKNYISNLF